MEQSGNMPDEKVDEQKQSYTIADPQDTEKCRGCPYPRVGFICWSKDGSCMKTDMDKISSRSRR